MCIRDRFNEGGDGGASGAGAHHRANGIHQKRLFDLGEVAILIQHIGLGAHGDQRAEGSKEVAGKQDEDPYQRAGDVCQHGLEVVAQHQIADFAHIRQGHQRSRQRRHAHRNADDGADNDADQNLSLIHI